MITDKQRERMEQDYTAGCLKCSWTGMPWATAEEAKKDAERHALRDHNFAGDYGWKENRPS